MIFKNGQAQIHISRIEEGQRLEKVDFLAIEEPLEIRLDYAVSETERNQKSVSITMRTPGDDRDLAIGFLLTEGILDPKKSFSHQIDSADHCGPVSGPVQLSFGHSNVFKIMIKNTVELNLRTLERNFYTTSSCGVCGKASIEALKLKDSEKLKELRGETHLSLSATFVQSLPERLRKSQELFQSTGGLHASGLFDSSGNLIVLREDVGRHNALDKVIGWAFQQGKLPLSHSILVLSGRISFELVQKASMAGIPAIVAVGAPSSLALQLAEEVGMTLIGFVRNERFNIYSGAQRVQ
jgi:FdhD protein